MSSKRTRKKRGRTYQQKKDAQAQRTKKDKAKAVASEALDRVGTVLFLEYFVPHYIEPSVLAAVGVLAASVLVFLVRCFRQIKGPK